MGKKRYRQFSNALYENLLETTDTHQQAHQEIEEGELAFAGQIKTWQASPRESVGAKKKNSTLLKMGKFRFQVLHEWLTAHFAPCRVADIGGGKGLLAYLLQKSGWDAVVIDPVYQTLPEKYKDLERGSRVRVAPTEAVPHVTDEFTTAMGGDFDLLIGLHAHGCNVKIIDAVAAYHCRGVLFPCCIIDEPLYPIIGVPWLQCLVDYALQKGLKVQPFRLPFSGQNIGLLISADE